MSTPISFFLPVQPQTLSDATTATIAKSQTADFPNEPVAGPSRDCRLRHSEEKVLVEEALSRKGNKDDYILFPIDSLLLVYNVQHVDCNPLDVFNGRFLTRLSH